MRAHYFKHVPFEGVGSMEPWLSEAGYEISGTRFYAEEPLPQIDDVDLLIVMGGPMSVNDGASYPWLAGEQRFIRQVIERGKPVLGICLGAQLIAKAMGAKVVPNPEKEIGWFSLERVQSSGVFTFRFPKRFEAFHWHGETFDLPRNASHLARSKACENQAFQIGRHVIGLQFHLETTPDSARALIHHCREELQEASFTQSEAEMMSVPEARYASLNRLMADVLAYLNCQRESQ